MELLSCPDGCEPCFYFPFTHPRPHSPAGLLGVHSDADGYTQMVDPVMHPVYKKNIQYYVLYTWVFLTGMQTFSRFSFHKGNSREIFL